MPILNSFLLLVSLTSIVFLNFSTVLKYRALFFLASVLALNKATSFHNETHTFLYQKSCKNQQSLIDC